MLIPSASMGEMEPTVRTDRIWMSETTSEQPTFKSTVYTRQAELKKRTK